MKTWSFISQRKFRKSQHLLCFFGFQWPNNRVKMVSASHNDQKYPRYPLALKLNVTLARPLRLVILYFFLMEILVRWSALVSSWQQIKLEIWCGWAHPYKTIAKFIVHSIHMNPLSRNPAFAPDLQTTLALIELMVFKRVPTSRHWKVFRR